LRLFILTFIALLLPLYPAKAQLNFLFSETVPGGTITGEIDGLTLNATSTPTALIIFSQPSGYPVGPTNLLAAGSGYIFYGTDNNFTVNALGQITGADLGIYKPVTGGYQGYAFDVTEPALGFTNANGIYETDTGGAVLMSNANTGGFGGITYTSVPEPRQTMGFVLLAAIGLLGGRKLIGKIRDKHGQIAQLG